MNNFEKHKGETFKNSPLNYSRYFLPFIITLTVVVFFNTLGNNFINNWDDNSYILENETIKQLNWNTIKTLFSTFSQSNYHPLTLLSYAIEYKVFGINPFYFHLSNLVLHVLNCILVFHFLKQFTGKPLVAGITALLFSIHPMHVESVAWISERKDLLYTLFFLLSLNSYTKALQAQHKFPHLTWSFLWFVLSLLSKPAAACLPLVLVLMDYYKYKTFSLQTFISKVPFFAIALVFGMLAIKAQSSGAIQDIAPLFTILDRLFLTAYSIVYYLFNAVFPFNLSALHFYPIKLNGVLPIAYYIALPTLILLIFWVIKAKHIKQELIFGLLFYLVTILMVLQIIPVGRAIVSERYSYVPYIGLFFIFGSFIDDIFHQKIVFTDKIRSFIPYLILSLVVFYSIFTYNRNKVWKNGIVLFTDVIEKYPEEGFGWSTRAYSKNINGDFEGAVIDYTKAIELNPKNPKIYFNRGNNYMSMEKFDLANADYSLAIKYDPNYSKAYNNRGFSFINLKMTNESLKDFNTAIAIDSKCTDAYFNRGNIYFEIKNFDKAIQDYNSVIELNPSHTKAYYNKGVINYTMGDKSAACQNWQAAKNLGNSDAVSLLDRFCK